MKSYRKKLIGEMNQLTKKIILAFFVVFSLTMIVGTIVTLYFNTKEAQKETRSILEELYDNYEDKLEFNRYNQNYIGFVEGVSSTDKIYQTYYNFNLNSNIKADVIVADKYSKILFTTLKSDEKNSLLQDKYKSIGKSQLDHTAYISSIIRLPNAETNLILTCGLYKEDKLIGYISYLYNNTSFNYELTSKYYKAAIVDDFNNVLATSSNEYISGHLHRLDKAYQTSGLSRDYQNQFIYVYQSKYKNGIRIVNIINLNGYLNTYRYGILLIIVFIIVLLYLVQKYSKILVDNNAKNIEQLSEQMEKICRGDLNYRIQLHSNDEFEELSNDINDMVQTIQVVIKRNSTLHYEKRISERKQLEAQLNPHFIYNTLETIRYTIALDQEVASKLILKLTRILRYSIDNSENEVFLEEEVELLKPYIDILKYRFKEKLSLQMKIDENAKNKKIIKFVIQPLIENSIKYGYQKKEKIAIVVNAYIKNSYLYIEVEDDGLGIDECELLKLNQSLKSTKNETSHNGLFNISRRLYLTYGAKSTIDLQSEQLKGTKVIIRIPVEEENDVSYLGGRR